MSLRGNKGQAVPMIRSSVVSAVVSKLEGHPAGRELYRVNQQIPLHKLKTPYERIALSQYVALMESAARVTGDTFFGARLGHEAPPGEILGPLGFLILASPRLRTGLENLSRYISVWQNATEINLHQNGDTVSWSYRISVPAIWPRRQDAEFTVSATCSMIRSLLGQKWRPLAIHFEHQAPKDRRPLQAILGAPLEFDQAFNSIIIDARDLDQRLTPGNTAYAPYFERYIKDMLSEQREETTIEQQVAKVISSKLGQEAIGVPEIAVEMGISPRSLQRHLAAEKTSVRIITRNVRLAEAQALLSVNRMHVGAISDALGYADGTAFWRAFKSWAGVSPTAFGRRAARRPSA